MIKLIIKKFIKDGENVNDKDVREKYGVLGGVLGIICNTLLFGIKLIAGLLMNSIAITSDAFNNLSDMGSSLVALIGAKLSNKRPDKEHPFGHGRVEYISSLIVSFLILLMGFELLKTSVTKIFYPQEMKFNVTLIIILSLSVLVKVWMFYYSTYMGKKINSAMFRAVASDSISDVVATSAIIGTTIIGRYVDFPALDGIVGTIVACLIVKTGYEVARDTIGMLLGTPASKEMVNEITERVTRADGIVGAHDLIIHDYGPGRVMASIHAEVPDDIDVIAVHETIDQIEREIEQELDVHMVIHMDPISINCERTNSIRRLVEKTVLAVNKDYSIHDFRIVDGENRINLIFDMVVPFGLSDINIDEDLVRIRRVLSSEDSRYNCLIQLDNHY